MGWRVEGVSLPRPVLLQVVQPNHRYCANEDEKYYIEHEVRRGASHFQEISGYYDICTPNTEE